MEGLSTQNLMNIEISGSGTAFPENGRWMSNEDIHALIFGENWQQRMIEKKLDPAYYESELGFKNRYWVHTPGTSISHDELNSADLMIEAANNAISDSGLKKTDIDFVITVTITSPRYATSMGPYVAGKLGIHAPALEMKSGCASNIFSMVLAAQLIRSGAKNVLIACGETTSKIIRPKTNMMYAGGDAGAAIIISKTNSADKGILSSYLNSEGSFSGHMGIPGLLPPNIEDIEQDNYYLTYSDAAEDFLNRAWNTTPQILCEAANIDAANIDCLVPHQVLKRRTRFVSEAAQVPMYKTVDVLADYANCGSATILLALHCAIKNGQLRKDQTALLIAAGGGVSWGGIILRT